MATNREISQPGSPESRIQTRCARKRETSRTAKFSLRKTAHARKTTIPKAFEQPSMFDGFDTEPTEKLTCWTPCSPREVFKSEAQLEETPLRDPSALAIISEQVGMEFARIARQVRTGRSLAQRADLVAIGSSPALPVIVIELMLPALNGEHVTRPIGYAVSLQSKNIVLIAD